MVYPRALVDKGKKLNSRQMEFVMGLLESDTYDPIAVCRQMGYKNPSQEANRMMRNKTVKHFIEKHKREREERTRISSDDVWRKIYEILEFDPAELFKEGQWSMKKLSEMPVACRKMIEGIKIDVSEINGEVVVKPDIKFISKSTALSIAAKHALPVKHEVDHTVTINLDDLLVSSEDDRNIVEGMIEGKEEE